MEFALMCPNDGRVELGLESVTAVVFHGAESVEVVFVCRIVAPPCGRYCPPPTCLLRRLWKSCGR